MPPSPTDRRKMQRVLRTFMEPFCAPEIGLRLLRASVTGEVDEAAGLDVCALYAEAEALAEEVLGTDAFWTFDEGEYLRFLPTEHCGPGGLPAAR